MTRLKSVAETSDDDDDDDSDVKLRPEAVMAVMLLMISVMDIIMSVMTYGQFAWYEPLLMMFVWMVDVLVRMSDEKVDVEV